MVFTTSQRGIDLIKEFEGLKLESYRCPAGRWTIGYGTTILPNGDFVWEGMMITLDRAEKLLRHDLVAFERHVNRLVTAPITQPMFDALVSFTYNVGAMALSSSTMLALINDGKFTEAAEQFPRWNKAGGRTLAGLTRRRKAEQSLFMEGITA